MSLFGKLRRKAADAPPPPATAPEPPPVSPAENRRRSERFATAVVSCILGEVQDLSATGMRVSAAAPPPVPEGMLFEFDLQSPTDTLTVVGRLVRCRKRHGRYDLGVEFQRMNPELTAAVECLARHGAVRGVKPAIGAGVRARVQLPDLYAMLGVLPAATQAEIQHAFRELARKNHPDVNKEPGSHEQFVDLLKAYDILRDTSKRYEYDRARLKAAA